MSIELFEICYFIYFLIYQRRRRLSICISNNSLKGDADRENMSMTLTKETRVAKPRLLFEGGIRGAGCQNNRVSFDSCVLSKKPYDFSLETQSRLLWLLMCICYLCFLHRQISFPPLKMEARTVQSYTIIQSIVGIFFMIYKIYWQILCKKDLLNP
jgi:hypothetical protein